MTPLGAETNAIAVAVASVLVAFLLATLVDRAFRARVLRDRVLRGELALSREADTRLRFVRRLVYAAIVFVGIALALSQFADVNRFATSLLASGAIAAAIVGFAARQTLANFVAGIMLAISQPIRVGDWVQVEDHYGVVEDVRLNYTLLRTAAGQRVIVPNERLTSGVIRNDTLTQDRVALDVAVWIAPGADADRALTALGEETGTEVTVAEAVPWGVRLTIGAEPVAPLEKAGAEAQLRARCLRRLRAEGLLQGPVHPGGADPRE